jgi:spore maturation protein CgeB
VEILLLYLANRISPGFYLEKSLLQEANVTSFDLKRSPYWSDYNNVLPFYIPKGIPVSIRKLIRQYRKRFDVAIEIDTSGQYHCGGFKRKNTPYYLWALDVYRYDKRKFLSWFKNDFDIIFVSQKDYLDIFPPSQTIWLPYAADASTFKKYALPKIYDITFVGNIDPSVYAERMRLLDRLKKRFNVHVFTSIYGNEVARIYSQSKIIFNKSLAGELNMRVFEAMSCGSLLLTDKIGNGLLDLFENRKHLVAYENDDIEDLVTYYLSHEHERESIAAAGRQEVLMNHTYAHRSQRIMQTYSESRSSSTV